MNAQANINPWAALDSISADLGDRIVSSNSNVLRVPSGQAQAAKAGAYVTEITREEIKAHIEAAEARTDRKIGEALGAIDRLSLKMDGLSDQMREQRQATASNLLWTIGTIIGTGLAVVGLLYTMQGVGAASWYNGTVVRDLIHQEMQDKK